MSEFLNPLTEFNHKSIQCQAPILNRHGPLLSGLSNRQINYLHCRLVVWKQLATLGGGANHAVERLDCVRGVNRFAYLWRVFKQRAQVYPVCGPGLGNLRVGGVPLLTKAVQFSPGLVFSGSLVYPLQVGCDGLVVLPDRKVN